MTATILIPLNEDPRGPMSAPALRRYEIGQALADEFRVVFTTKEDFGIGSDIGKAEFRIVRARKDLQLGLRDADFLYTLGVLPRDYLTIVRSGVPVILDLYVPRAFEVLEASPQATEAEVRRDHWRTNSWTVSQLKLAQFLVCTNSYQRDFWIGMLNGAGMLDIRDTRACPDLTRQIGVVPQGIPTGEMKVVGSPLRDRLGLSSTDILGLWSSRVLAWQDPRTLMTAMAELRETNPEIKVVLLGTGPLPDTVAAQSDGHAFRTMQAVDAARQLGILDKNVFFVEERFPYLELGPLYADCDFAVATYPNSLETRYCLATRLLDYLYADLPLVLSGLELQEEFIEQNGCGIYVQPHSSAALADAMRTMTSEEKRADYVSQIRGNRLRLEWPRIVEPIAQYCREHPERGQHRLATISAVRELLRFGLYHCRMKLGV